MEVYKLYPVFKLNHVIHNHELQIFYYLFRLLNTYNQMLQLNIYKYIRYHQFIHNKFLLSININMYEMYH